jgi:hypothetical protein
MVPYTLSSSIFRHWNARASALTMALWTCGGAKSMRAGTSRSTAVRRGTSLTRCPSRASRFGLPVVPIHAASFPHLLADHAVVRIVRRELDWNELMGWRGRGDLENQFAEHGAGEVLPFQNRDHE